MEWIEFIDKEGDEIIILDHSIRLVRLKDDNMSLLMTSKEGLEDPNIEPYFILQLYPREFRNEVYTILTDGSKYMIMLMANRSKAENVYIVSPIQSNLNLGMLAKNSIYDMISKYLETKDTI